MRLYKDLQFSLVADESPPPTLRRKQNCFSAEPDLILKLWHESCQAMSIPFFSNVDQKKLFVI